MKKIYSIYDGDQDKILVSFTKRETAFKVLKEKANSQAWREFNVQESEVYEDSDILEPFLYYRATCGIADQEIDVKEESYFPPFDDAPDIEASDVNVNGTNITCEGRNLEKVITNLRQFIAKKRYEFEHAVRKVCSIVQPKIENGEAMTVDMICNEADVAQDTVIKILLLLKKEGFLDIVDPLEQKQVVKPEIVLPGGAKAAYQQTSGQKDQITGSGKTNVGFDKKGRLRKIKPGQQATFPIYKKKK